MKNAIMGKLLGFAGRRLDGKKTVIGIISFVLLGLSVMALGAVGLVGTMFPDSGLPAMEWETASTLIATGYGVLSLSWTAYGAQDKLVKLTDALSAAINESKKS